jgi:hypothetical protein
MSDSKSGYVKVVLHSEHGRVPETVRLRFSEVVLPGEMVRKIKEFFGDCKRAGGVTGLMSFINKADTVNAEEPYSDREPEYTYHITMFPEASLSGETNIEITVDNHVDEPLTENLDSISPTVAASLA